MTGWRKADDCCSFDWPCPRLRARVRHRSHPTPPPPPLYFYLVLISKMRERENLILDFGKYCIWICSLSISIELWCSSKNRKAAPAVNQPQVGYSLYPGYLLVELFKNGLEKHQKNRLKGIIFLWPRMNRLIKEVIYDSILPSGWEELLKALSGC